MADRKTPSAPVLDRRGTLGLAAVVAAFGAALGMNVTPARADPTSTQYKLHGGGSTGSTQLKSGGSQFKSGGSQFKSGSTQLKSGSNQLKSGSNQLKSGSNQLKFDTR